MSKIYVMAHDGGCEGHSPPLQAFANLTDAAAALRLIKTTGDVSMQIYAVALWPEVNSEPWHADIKSIALEA